MLEYVKKHLPGKQKAPSPHDPSSADPPSATYGQNIEPSIETSENDIAPVLSPADEQFLRTALDDPESAEQSYLIFEGSSQPETPGTVTPILAEAAQEAGSQEFIQTKTDQAMEKEYKKEEWKGAISTSWDGFCHALSTSRDKLPNKWRTPQKDKGKGKEVENKLENEEVKEDNKTKQSEFDIQEDELVVALDRLNLAAKDGQTFSLTAETKIILSRFTQILKDIINGVPTAYDDLISFLDTSSKDLEKTFRNLPGFLQKLIRTLPSKLTKNLNPELLRAAAAASPALAQEGATMPGLKELITKPGLLVGMLRGVVNVLKTRFPALIGANMALSMGLFVLLLILWYCHKRGREIRLENEETARLAEEAEKEAVVAAIQSTVEGDFQGASKF